MKKVLAFSFVSLLISLLFCAALCGFAADEGEEAESAVYKGIVAAATDMDGDGLLDAGGKMEIDLVLPVGKGLCRLTFTKSEFAAVALCKGSGKNVSLEPCEGYAVNTVVEMNFWGFVSVFDGEMTEAKRVEIKKGLAAFAAKSGSAAVLPTGNELYSTYLLLDSGKTAILPAEAEQARFSFCYDAEKGSASLTYRGVTYTAVKKLDNNDVENPIVITMNGKYAPLAEIDAFVKSVAEGEMEVLFGDVYASESGEQAFELADFRSARAFAPVSAELNAAVGERGEAYSYILFDREVRASVPDGYVFSARSASGAGLSIVLCADEAGAGYYRSASLLCRVENGGEYTSLQYARGEAVTAAERSGEYIKVTLESGRALLLPAESALENREMRAELFYSIGGGIGSVSVLVNAEECSWFASLSGFYAQNGCSAEKLLGARLTAAFDAEGRAVFAEIE